MAATRRAEVIWQGDLLKGEGLVSAKSSGLFNLQPVTWASRTAADAAPGTVRTSPEELLAAAHASCFAMALSGQLGKAGTAPARLEVAAEVSFDKVGDGFKVTKSALLVRAVVPGADDAAFDKAVQAAKDGCPISQALEGNVDITVEAALASAVEATLGTTT